MRGRKEEFFFEKKNQKTFIRCPEVPAHLGRIGATRNRQKFFGSFFQKRTFLPLPFLCVALAACTVGPDYRRPAAPISTHFKELAGWKPAAPSDAAPKGDWWQVFGDPTLDQLERHALTANQTIAAQQAAYDQARALTDEARAALYPTLGVNAGALRTGAGHTRPANEITAQATVSWEPDIWGKVRRQVESNEATALADAALVANARLSAGAALATDYMDLAIADANQRLLDDTVRNDRRSLDITKNQYAVGVAARSDVILAQTQLDTAQSAAVANGIARGQFEHAIAVLAGEPPADLTIPPIAQAPRLPDIPVALPSTLLERRPDIAAAERSMAAANALIGVAVAAYYPAIDLSGAFGFASDGFGSLFSVANSVWSFGGTASDTIFDAGARGAAVAAARAQYDATVATYRQTVLTALQQVEDALVGLRILAQQAVIQGAAVRDASQAAEISLNEYRAGTQPYTTVVTAQNTLLSAQQTQLTIQQSRLQDTVTLITSLGGGWNSKNKE
jgi:NodT family efflux transporter outer membrane factor (OMF) lipoprotein